MFFYCLGPQSDSKLKSEIRPKIIPTFPPDSGQLQAWSPPDWSAMACGTSEKVFTEAGSLKKHLLTHSGEKSHMCGICDKAFTLAGHLKKHLLTHSGEKPHKCGTCEKAFTIAGNLKRHTLKHQ